MSPAARAFSAFSLDRVLCAQIVVAWAGERQRLGWWRTDLVDEYGGEDLFRRLLPHTWRWAVLQGAREAARRHDAMLRARAHDPDQLVTLFRLGFEVDERLDERLQDLKATGQPPEVVLPALAEALPREWSAPAFASWVSAHGEAPVVTEPAGRRIRGGEPKALEAEMELLVAALAPLAPEYPLPHFRRTS